jgi:hypothetical protein
MSLPEPSASYQVISSMAVNQVNKALRHDLLLPLSFAVLLRFPLITIPLAVLLPV